MHYFWDAPRMDTIVDGKVVERGGSCIDQFSFYMIQSGLTVLTDILILLIPPAMMWNLQMKREKKIAVWAVLSLGWIVALVGITRMVLYYHRLQPDNIDRSYSVAYTISIMEANVAIMASCGPALKALFTRYLPQMFASRTATETQGNVRYWPGDYQPSGDRVRSVYSEQLRTWGSKSGRPRDMQYGMNILESIERDNDVESQEPIVRSASVKTDKSGFDFEITTKGSSCPESTAYSSDMRPA